MENPFAAAPAGLLAACLVVEDDSLIRLDLEETLRDFGVRCVHGAATMERAMQIVETSEIRFAVLDFELVHGNTAKLAEILVARGIPSVFLTAYGAGLQLPSRLRHLGVIAKPFNSHQLAQALLVAFERDRTPCSKDVCCAEPPG